MLLTSTYSFCECLWFENVCFCSFTILSYSRRVCAMDQARSLCACRVFELVTFKLVMFPTSMTLCTCATECALQRAESKLRTCWQHTARMYVQGFSMNTIVQQQASICVGMCFGEAHRDMCFPNFLHTCMSATALALQFQVVCVCVCGARCLKENASADTSERRPKPDDTMEQCLTLQV